MAKGDEALEDAIRFYTQQVYVVSSSGLWMPQEEWEKPLFTYLLTKKQFNQINRICHAEGWPRQTNPGITVYPHHIKHVLTSRAKDGLSWVQVSQILCAAFCTHSEIALNKDRDMQGVILNSVDRLTIVSGQKHYGMAILQVSENDLAPVTAYHASEAKIKAIKKNSV